MAESRAASIVPVARAAGMGCEVWTEGATGELPDGTPVVPIWQALPLATAQPVGLFVSAAALEEFAAVYAPTGDATGLGSFLKVAEQLLMRASLLGSVTAARFYTGSVEEPIVEVSGLSRQAAIARLESVAVSQMWGDSDAQLRADLWEEAQAPCAPQTWIVVTDDPAIAEVGPAARARRRRIVLWVPGEEPPARSVRGEVDACMALAGVLDLPHPGAAHVAPTAPRRSQPPLRETPRGALPGEGRIAEQPVPYVPEGGSVAQDSLTAAGRLTPQGKIAYHLECLRRGRREASVTETAVAESLAGRNDFAEDASLLEWLDRACAEGVLLRERGVGPDDARTTRLRPNPDHPCARAALDIPDRCLRLLHQMLHKMPWVSFKLLRGVLLREQWLGGPPYRLDEAGVDEWVNFLILDGAIQMTKERNLVNPEYPVTALRLDPAHPLAAAVVLEAGGTARLAPQRAILAVDHFLTRNRKPWMSIGALRRALDSLGREDLQTVLQQLQDEDALITESYPNPQKEHPTTGCHLGMQSPLVQETLARRDAIVQAVLNCAGDPGRWTSLAEVDSALRAAMPEPFPADERLGWFQLLRAEGVLELNPDLPLTKETEISIRCRLASDAVTRQVLTRADDERPNGRSSGTADLPRAEALEV